jgi:hypothetical protein
MHLSAVTSSSRSASISLSESLRSPALVVCLCAVSMSSSLAQRSHIFHSMAGSTIFLPLHRCISLSSGSGDCTSLLLGGMVNSPLLCYRKQRTLLCSDTTLTQSRSSVHVRSQDLLLLTARRTQKSFYFPIGKSAPTEFSVRSPLFAYQGIGLRSFASLVVAWFWILKTPNPDASQR